MISVNLLMCSQRFISRVDHKVYETHHNRILSRRLQSILEDIGSRIENVCFIRACAVCYPYTPLPRTGARSLSQSLAICWRTLEAASKTCASSKHVQCATPTPHSLERELSAQGLSQSLAVCWLANHSDPGPGISS